MPTILNMPALSPTMMEGNLAKWHVKEGDAVSAGDLLAEIETDKATMEFEAVDDGVVGKLLVPEGSDAIEVNLPIAVILAEGEDPSAIDQLELGDPPATAPARTATEPAAVPPAAAPARTATEPAAVPPAAAAPTLPQPSKLPGKTVISGSRKFSSPLARRLAVEHGLDIGSIAGSGPDGRVVKRDIARALQRPAAAPPAPSPEPVRSPDDSLKIAAMLGDREYEEVPLDGMRKTIAARLVEAKQSIPHFYLRREIALDEVLKLRIQVNQALQSRDLKISINDFVIRASALALQTVPDANAVWAHDRILRVKPSDVAVAVAVEGGLFTPIIRDAHAKSLAEISREMKELAQKARTRKLSPMEYTGGAFSISNLGMFGIESFDAVINPPHGSILAVGAGRRLPVESEDGSVAFRSSMSVTLSCDHRVIDGALGASFLGEIARHIEQPMLLLI